jgi:cell division protein FtsQ
MRTPQQPAEPARWTGRAAAVFALACAAGVAVGAGGLASGGVEVISVAGIRTLSAQEVAEAGGLAPGSPLHQIDRDALVARLAEHAWIARASTLTLPGGRLLLGVVERQPAAVLLAPEPWALDAAGVAFAPAPSVGVEQLPRITTPTAPTPDQPAPELAQAVALARRLPEIGLPAPLEVGVAAPGDPEGFSLQLPELTPRVVLGRDDLDAKLSELARLLDADLPELRKATRLDLRFQGQAVLDVEPFPPGTAKAAAARGSATPSNRRTAG